MAQIEVKVKLDLPPGVELLVYERCGDGRGRVNLRLWIRPRRPGRARPMGRPPSARRSQERHSARSDTSDGG